MCGGGGFRLGYAHPFATQLAVRLPMVLYGDQWHRNSFS